MLCLSLFPPQPFDLFAGLGLDSLQSSLSTPTPALQPNPPMHGGAPTGDTTHPADSGLMKIDFSEAKGTTLAMAQQQSVGGSGGLLGTPPLTPETPRNTLGPGSPSSLPHSSSGPVSSLTAAEKKAAPSPSLGWSSSIARRSRASHGVQPSSSLTSGSVRVGPSALGNLGSNLSHRQLTDSGPQFNASRMGMNQPGTSQTGFVPQPLLQPQTGMNVGSGLGMTHPQSGMNKQFGMGTDLLQPQSGMSIQPGSQMAVLQPQSGMSSKPDLGVGLLQQKSGMNLQSDLGRDRSVANGFDGSSGTGLLSQPLHPTQPSSSYSSSSMGWSSGIIGQHQPASATPPSSMGWSSSIIGQHQQASTTPPSAMGWSAGIAGQNSSYSSGVGELGCVSVGSAAPPTAASLMMGASQPLIPQQQQTSQLSFLQPSPGPNPFVNNNSLI